MNFAKHENETLVSHGKTFTRIGKDIVMAVKEGGPDPDNNSRLRAVIQNAKAANMPKDNVERAIKKATDKNTENYKEVLFEGYAPYGIAPLVETATNNNNRTVATEVISTKPTATLAPRARSNYA